MWPGSSTFQGGPDVEGDVDNNDELYFPEKFNSIRIVR